MNERLNEGKSFDEILMEGSQETGELRDALRLAYSWMRSQYFNKAEKITNKKAKLSILDPKWDYIEEKSRDLNNDALSVLALEEELEQESNLYLNMLLNQGKEGLTTLLQASELKSEGYVEKGRELARKAEKTLSNAYLGTVELLEESVRNASTRLGLMTYLNNKSEEVLGIQPTSSEEITKKIREGTLNLSSKQYQA